MAVVSDEKKLMDLISYVLHDDGIEVLCWDFDVPAQPSVESRIADGVLDLIILVLSLPYSEPVVGLVKASLIQHVGQVPLLVISERQFRTEETIHRLHYPFDMQDFREKTNCLLGRGKKGEKNSEPILHGKKQVLAAKKCQLCACF